MGLAKANIFGATIIGDSVYIGINSTILGGIKIGNDVLVAPNTLHSIVIGNPGKIYLEKMRQISM